MEYSRKRSFIGGVKKIDDLRNIYGTPEAESMLKLVVKSVLWTPYVLWKMRKFSDVKATEFQFTNRNQQELDGVMYGLDDSEQRPIVAYDCGYKKGRSDFPMIGKTLACLGYRAVSIFSREELKAKESDDYTDALSYLRLYSEYKQFFGPKTAFLVISGGCNIMYRSCSSQEFVNKNNVVCGISIAAYSNLSEEFEHMRKKLKESNIDPNTKEVLTDYNDYATRIGIVPSGDPKLFRLGSPETYAPDMKKPVLLIHGVYDEIVPSSGSIHIYKTMKRAGKEAKLVLTPGEGVHGNPDKWLTSLTELAGITATIGYAYRYLKKRFGE
jgi:hypothetical protein